MPMCMACPEQFKQGSGSSQLLSCCIVAKFTLQARVGAPCLDHTEWLSASQPSSFCFVSLTRAEKLPYEDLVRCRRALVLNEGHDLVVKVHVARGRLQSNDDVLSQPPLGASPHFFSMQSPDPMEQDKGPLPTRTTPAPVQHVISMPRAHVSVCLPCMIVFLVHLQNTCQDALEWSPVRCGSGMLPQHRSGLVLWWLLLCLDLMLPCPGLI